MRKVGAALGAVLAMALGCGGTSLVTSDRAPSNDAGATAPTSVTVFDAYSTVPNGTEVSGVASLDLKGSAIAVKNALPGDVLYIDFDGQVLMPANSGLSLLGHVTSSAPDGVTLENGAWQQTNAASGIGAFQAIFFSAYTVTAAGDFTASVQSSVNGKDAVAIYGGVVRVRLERP